jgi:hypothetical protein
VILQANRIEDFFSCSSLKSVLQNSDLLIINLVVNLVADYRVYTQYSKGDDRNFRVMVEMEG